MPGLCEEARNTSRPTGRGKMRRRHLLVEALKATNGDTDGKKLAEALKG